VGLPPEQTQVRFTFRHFPLEQLDSFCRSQRTLDLVDKFLDNEAAQCIFFREGKNIIEVRLTLHSAPPYELVVNRARTLLLLALQASDQPIPGTQAPLYYFAKLHRARVSEEEYRSEIISGQVADDPLAHLAQVAEQVYQVMQTPITFCFPRR
jgi:hypothetical protein